ncbi:MAG TPA: hypothetical protein PKD10_07685 [Paracoccaceae bacterium]|nr:hypothetical protein [Paracoccaceae bacterium]
MAALVFFLILPVVTYLSLLFLPAGRPALIGIAVAAGAMALILPQVAPEDGSGFGEMLLWLYGGAVALAALAQGLRVTRLPGGGAPPYPLVAALCLLGAAVPAALILGIF